MARPCPRSSDGNRSSSHRIPPCLPEALSRNPPAGSTAMTSRPSDLSRATSRPDPATTSNARHWLGNCAATVLIDAPVQTDCSALPVQRSVTVGCNRCFVARQIKPPVPKAYAMCSDTTPNKKAGPRAAQPGHRHQSSSAVGGTSRRGETGRAARLQSASTRGPLIRRRTLTRPSTAAGHSASLPRSIRPALRPAPAIQPQGRARPGSGAQPWSVVARTSVYAGTPVIRSAVKTRLRPPDRLSDVRNGIASASKLLPDGVSTAIIRRNVWPRNSTPQTPKNTIDGGAISLWDPASSTNFRVDRQHIVQDMPLYFHKIAPSLASKWQP